MHILKVRTFARATGPFAFVEPGRHFNLDHLRAPVGELAHGGRTGAYAREVEHLDVGERAGGLHRFEFTLRVEEESRT
jgi:hypothetical protein